MAQKTKKTQEEITINFNMSNERDRRIFSGIKNLPGYFGEIDTSEAFIKFVDNLIATLMECEERRAECENMLNHFTGKKESRH